MGAEKILAAKFPLQSAFMDLMIREFWEADRAALQTLFMLARNAAFPWQPPGAHRREDFDQQTEGERILVALDRKLPIGFAAVWEPESFLHHLFVHPDYFRRGVGTALLSACEPYFRTAPTLKCVQQNERALRFYRALGWRVVSEGVGEGGPYYLLEGKQPSGREQRKPQ